MSGVGSEVARAEKQCRARLPCLPRLEVCGKAGCNGLYAHPEFSAKVCAELAHGTGSAFASAHNKFQALASHEALLFAHGALKALAAGLMKIANDVRWLASAPSRSA